MPRNAMSDLPYFVSSERPEDQKLVGMCRDVLVQIITGLPPDQARILYEHATRKHPQATESGHQAWLDSHQCRAIALEIQFQESPNS